MLNTETVDIEKERLKSDLEDAVDQLIKQLIELKCEFEPQEMAGLSEEEIERLATEDLCTLSCMKLAYFLQSKYPDRFDQIILVSPDINNTGWEGGYTHHDRVLGVTKDGYVFSVSPANSEPDQYPNPARHVSISREDTLEESLRVVLADVQALEPVLYPDAEALCEMMSTNPGNYPELPIIESNGTAGEDFFIIEDKPGSDPLFKKYIEEITRNLEDINKKFVIQRIKRSGAEVSQGKAEAELPYISMKYTVMQIWAERKFLRSLLG